MGKLLAILFVLGVMVQLSTQQEKQNFCGRRLANALSLLCVNGLMLEKRSEPTQVVRPFGMMNYATPWLMERPRPMARTTRGRRTGIIEECCDNPCSIDQLMDYCIPPEV